MPIRRIVVAIDASRTSIAALRASTLLAARLRAEVAGIFVEDVDLVRWASLPFARRIGSFSAAARPLRSGELERQLRLQAERAERALMHAAEEVRIHASFRVAQGSVAGELLAAMGEADLLSLGAGPLPTAQGSRLGSTARAVLTRAAGQVLVVPREAAPRGPLVVVADDSGSGIQALQTAEDLAAARAERRAAGESSATDLDLLVTCTGAEDTALDGFIEKTTEQLRARRLAATVRRALPLDLVELAAAARAHGAAMLIVGVESADRSETVIEAVVGAFGGPVLVVGRAEPPSRG